MEEVNSPRISNSIFDAINNAARYRTVLRNEPSQLGDDGNKHVLFKTTTFLKEKNIYKTAIAIMIQSTTKKNQVTMDIYILIKIDLK